MGIVTTSDVRSTANRYSSCSTSTTIHVFRPETNEEVSNQPMNDIRVLCLKHRTINRILVIPSFQSIPTLLLVCGPNAIICNQKLPPSEESGLMNGGYLRRFVHYVWVCI